MTELERARAHLFAVQHTLAMHRRDGSAWTPWFESCVLAALSWVWDEQQKSDLAERKAELGTWLDGIISERFA